MKITKRQLRRIIREESKGSTKKYDDDSALRGDQDELPDALQKGIIDKTVTDREEKEKNESFRVTKRQLRRMVKEEIHRVHERMDPDNPQAYDEYLASFKPTSHLQLLEIQKIIKTAFMNKSLGVKPEIADDYLKQIKGITNL